MAAVLVALALVIGLLIGMVGVGGVLLPPGLASAITGTGGPVILVPILLLLGVAPIVAIAVSQGVQLPVVLAGSVGYLQTGLVDVRLGTLLGLVAALGAVGGAMVAPRSLPPDCAGSWPLRVWSLACCWWSGSRADPRSVEAVSADPFVTHRRLLFTVAYEMLGSAADAEDVVQDAWLKWSRVDRGEIRDPRAYLVRIVTRTVLDQVRTVSRRREEYVGQWLPEPLLTSPDIAEDVALADSLSTAMLLVLETLTPTQRAVFVLRDVFAFDYDEVAEAVDKTPAAVRQIAHRARSQVADRRPRGETSRAEVRGALNAFRRALDTGEVQGLLDVLAPDVVVLGDGGGIKQAVPNAVRGAERVARLFTAGLRTLGELSTATETVLVNGWPALFLRVDGEVDTVLSLRLEGGLVTGIFAVRNPEKLSHILTEAEIGR